MIPYIFIAFFIKHFICDFPLQKSYQYLNKGKYGHPGGLLHASIHGFGALLICIYFQLPLYFAAIDMIIHYHIDWAKLNINSHYKWKADNSEYFWWLLGLDQLLHYLTYAGLICLL